MKPAKQTPKREKRTGKGRGTIGIIIVLFLASASIRIVSGANEVMADASEPTDRMQRAVTDRQTANSPATPEEFEVLLRAFQEREARIAEQEDKIARRMKVLTETDLEVRKRLDELRAAEAALRSTIALASTAAEDDLARLTAVYENMKPKTAAALFQQMAPEFAAGFLGRMRPDSAASIMAGMTPESAYTVSTILAGRNAAIPKD